MKKIYWIAIAILLLFIVAPIIFFYLTTAHSEPQPVVVYAPKTEATDAPTHGKIINLILDDGKVYHHDSLGTKSPVLLDEKSLSELLSALPGKYGNDFTVVIKPLKNTTYQTTVNMLDQMTIHNIKNFSLEEATDNDYKLVTQKQ